MSDIISNLTVEHYIRGEVVINIKIRFGEIEEFHTLVFNEHQELDLWQIGHTLTRLPEPLRTYAATELVPH